ncbi:MAG: thioredoxin domain-containing protein [Candidatus Obscuribacterales bacterium]
MGIFFHRRAERANCIPQQTECAPAQPETCLPEDPRQQFVEIRTQKIETNTGKSKLPGQTELPPPAPAVDSPDPRRTDTPPARDGRRTEQTPAPLHDAHPPLPALVITDRTQPQTRRTPGDVPPPPLPDPELAGTTKRDLYQYADGKTNRTVRDMPPPPLPDPELAGNTKRDLYQYADGKPNRTVREVPPPPLPDPELAGNTKRDLYQYGDGKPNRPAPGTTKDQDLPQMPLDVPQTPAQTRRETDANQPPKPAEISNREAFDDHPGPGSRKRRSLREQLNLPERHSPDPGRPPINNTPTPDRTPNQRPNDQNFAPADYRQPTDYRQPAPRPGDGRVTDISAAQLKELIARSDRPILVDVWRERCDGCTALAPVMDKIAAQYQGQASVYRIHSREFLSDPQLRSQFKFNAVPTTLMFDGGRLLDQNTGARPSNYFEERLNGALSRHRQASPTDINAPQGPDPRRPQDRLTNDYEDPQNRKHNRVEARLERIKEKIARLTHFSAQEREVAFSPNAAEQRTLDLINNERRRHRLPDLVHDPRLQMIANRHTDYQVRYGMTHNENTPGWQNVSQRMSQVGLEGWRENAGSGAFTPESLVQMWMNSPGHRAAILGTGNIGAVCIRNGKATFNLTTDPELQRGA